MANDEEPTTAGPATPGRPLVGSSTDEWLAVVSGQLDELIALQRPTQQEQSKPATRQAAAKKTTQRTTVRD